MTKQVLGKKIKAAKRQVTETVTDLVLVATGKAGFVKEGSKDRVIAQLTDELIDRKERLNFWNSVKPTPCK